MSLLKRLKSLFGRDDRADERRGNQVGVTVERDPAAEDVVADAEPRDDEVGGTERARVDRPLGDDEVTGADTAEDEEGAVDDPGDEGEPTAQPVEEGDASEAPVTSISGIGPSYSERLSDAGVETVSQLVASDPEDLEEETGISAKRISRWIDDADSESDDP